MASEVCHSAAWINGSLTINDLQVIAVAAMPASSLQHVAPLRLMPSRTDTAIGTIH